MERPVLLEPTTLDEVRQLYEQGLYVQAYAVVEQNGGLAACNGTPALLLAGRLAGQLGAARRSNWLIRCGWKESPYDPEASYYNAYRILGRRGPLVALQWIESRPEWNGPVSADVRASWLALQGDLYGMLRDFDMAERCHAQAEAADPDNAWVRVCRSRLLELEDRYPEALDVARESHKLRPFYRPSVQAVAHYLTLLDRDQEALELLTEAVHRLESSAVAGQLFALQLELKLYAEARDTLERIPALCPLAEKATHQWLAAQRSEIAYHHGDIDEAIRQAELSESEFLKAIAERLRDAARSAAPVVSLPVGFVRQHHVTCGPATLTAISRFWSMPVDHVQLSDEICYDGTPAHSERKWAEDHGWYVREFSVTETSAADLIGRGIPFTLTTVEPANSHLQAVIGYDGRRGVLLIRDPYFRTANEGLADKIVEHYRPSGPRGMALVPRARRKLLEEIELPDAELWNAMHRLDTALVAHDRQRAQQVFEQMRADHGEHRLVTECRRRLAVYDNNLHERLTAAEILLKEFPDNAGMQLEHLSCLRDLAHRDQRLEIYQRICAKKDAHPIFWQQYAQELRADARRHEDAIWLLRRAIRRWPTHSANYYILANILWDRRRFPEALQLYRIAACLDDKDEQLARAYFIAAKWFKQTEEALHFLHNRFTRFGSKSSLPARTLFSAFTQLERTTEALQVLEQAMELRPDDGQLLLFAADGYVSCGLQHLARARELLERARDRSRHGEWLRTAARIAAADGQLIEALRLWQRVLQSEPLAIDAYSSAAQLQAETEGRPAALAFLHQAVERFPHYGPLQELKIEWLRSEPPDVCEPAIRHMIEMIPDNAWARRELAFLLGGQRRCQEAWVETDEAGRLDPDNPAHHALRAHLYRTEGRLPEAKAELRRAIELSVDYDYAISAWFELCDTAAERRSVMEFVQQQLVQQVIFGDGLLTFREYARRVLDPDELLRLLVEGRHARPDLWHAWSAGVQQLMSMNRLDDAWTLVCQATERFPLLPRLWLDRATVSRLREDWDSCQQALETAYEINPNWGACVRGLCDLHQRRGDLHKARELLEAAVARSPLDVWTHAELAEVLWKCDERQAAFERMEHAVHLDPSVDWGWEKLQEWAAELNCGDRVIQSVRDLLQRRVGESRLWLLLARLLNQPDQFDEQLAALDRATDIDPRNEDAFDLMATALAQAERWEAARAACHPAAWPDGPPSTLRAREAWLEAQQGRLPEAVTLMRSTLDEDPNHFSGWAMLAEWYRRLDDADGNLQAVREMVRINPHYELSQGYLAEALQLKGDLPGAQQAYRRAYELNPNYEFAGNGLFDVLLDQDQEVAAAELLDVLRQRHDSPYVLARELTMSVRRRQRQDSLECFARLCRHPMYVDEVLGAACERLVHARWGKDLEKVLAEECRRSDRHSGLAGHWIHVRTRLNLPTGRPMRKLAADGQDMGLIAYRCIHGLVEQRRFRRLRWFVFRHRDWLRRETFSWGAVAYGLASAGANRATIRWMYDWQSRTDAEPWMLLNYVEALRIHGQNELARTVSRQALQMPVETGKDGHRLWMALDAVQAGDLDGARDFLEPVGRDQLSESFAFLYDLAQITIQVRETPSHDTKTLCHLLRRYYVLRAAF
jgi:cellulose synthase operon protein C